MSKNVTLRLDEIILRKARHVAVEQDQSLSQWVADLIAKAISGQWSFQSAKKRSIKRMESGFHLTGRPLSRSQIYER